MVKVVIKKNIKPKKKVMKQKQTQKQIVNINIGDTITKKKRGRPTKKSKIEKKPIQQPITQSYNQPIFKQTTQQPSSLASSILASQNIPKVIKEEVKEESALKKALIDQNISTSEDPIEKSNDLERVRVERIKKVDKVKEKPIRSALLGQLLSDQGDDTEEIQSLFQPSEQSSVYPASSSNVSNVSSFTVSGTSTPTPLSRPVDSETLFDKLKQIQEEPFNTLIVEPEQEEPLAYTEEPTENALTNQQQEPTTTILEEETKPPTITQALEPVREGDQYTTEQLVKDIEPSNEIPTAQATAVLLSPFIQAQNKWGELKKQGLLKGTKYGKNKETLAYEINQVDPTWELPKPRQGGPVKAETTEPIITETSKKKRGRPPKRNDLVEEV